MTLRRRANFHDDFHPLNVLGEASQPIVIDWPNACRGNPAGDSCRSYLILKLHADEVAEPDLKAHRPGFKIWSGAQADIGRITTIWNECLAAHRGPYLFGKLTMADAMYAPVVTRFLTYDVKLDPQCAGYCERIMALPDMVAWRSAAMLEPEELEELDMEF
jgi:hypothetical protein